MKAARLTELGEDLVVVDVPDPVLRPGAVVVGVSACFVAPSAATLCAGGFAPYPMPPLPFTPGMDSIGKIEAVAEDVTGLAPGDPVYCNHHIHSRVAGAPADAAFIGYFGTSPESAALLARWPDGGFAEKLLVPVECVTPLGGAAGSEPALLARLGFIGTAYGGLLRAGFRPGQTLIVNGATGIVGTSAVLLGLAMGAARIVAMGRKVEVLDRLEQLDRMRVVGVALTGADTDAEAVKKAAGGADAMIDALGYTEDAGPTMAAIGGLAPHGTGVMLGGVPATLPIPYGLLLGGEISLTGSMWFPREAAASMLAMIAAGTLDLSPIEAHAYPLGGINDAIAAAAERPGGFDHVAVTPNA